MIRTGRISARVMQEITMRAETVKVRTVEAGTTKAGTIREKFQPTGKYLF